MHNEIAVISTENQQLCPLTEMTTIVVYKKSQGIWQERKVFPFSLRQGKNMDELRNDIRNLITKLPDCRIIAGKSIQGLAYQVFNRMGFHIFEISRLSGDILDGISLDADSATKAPEKSELPKVSAQKTARQIGEGIFYLDLIELQTSYPEISSKKALQPILAAPDFKKIDVLCSHIPLWLETPAYKKAFSLRTKKYGQNLLLSVSQK